MKKISKNILFVILGVIIAFSIDVAAEAVISSGSVSYSDTTVSAALDELFSAVDINEKIGTTDISAIGDGTITGALSTHNTSIASKTGLLKNVYQTTTQVQKNNSSVSSISGKASWKVIGKSTGVAQSMSNYNLYGGITLSADVIRGSKLFTIVPGSMSEAAFNFLTSHLSNVGYNSSPLSFTLINVETAVSYDGFYINSARNFAAGEPIPAGSYFFTFSYSI